MAKTLSDSELAEIHTHIFAHRKIQAIKLYREASGEGLKEAKDAVEAMTAQLRETDPQRFAPKPKFGCLPILVLAILVAATVGVGVGVGGCAKKTRAAKATAPPIQTASAAPAPTAPAPLTPTTSPSTRVVGSVYGKAVTAADIGLTAPIDTTVKFDARDDARWDLLGRIAVAFAKPVLDRFTAEHPVQVTDEELTALKKNLGDKYDEDFGRWFLAKWKAERELHRAYGGRVIFQQIGPFEALDARRRLYEEAEKKGDLHFDDPGVRHMFYYYYANMGHGYVDEKELEDPAFLKGED